MFKPGGFRRLLHAVGKALATAGAYDHTMPPLAVDYGLLALPFSAGDLEAEAFAGQGERPTTMLVPRTAPSSAFQLLPSIAEEVDPIENYYRFGVVLP